MLKHCSFLAYVLLLSILLTACAGDDDPEPTVTPPAATTIPQESATATPTEAESEPTATVEAATPTTEADEEAAPTATNTPEETPEVAGTMPPAPTEDLSPPTSTVAYEPDPQVEAALLDMLLEEEEVPEDFELVSAGPTGLSEEGLTFCNEEAFSRPGAQLGSVEAEFAVDPQMGPFVLEVLTGYEDDVAAEAFDYARETTTACEEWTDGEDVTYQIEAIEVPDYGDDSHGFLITFDVSTVDQASVEYRLARFGGVLLAIGIISLEGIDTAQFEDIVETAVEKIEAADPLP